MIYALRPSAVLSVEPCQIQQQRRRINEANKIEFADAQSFTKTSFKPTKRDFITFRNQRADGPNSTNERPSMSTPVSSIGASLIASAAKVSSGSSQNSSVAAAVAEANESKATTIKEAQNGDRVAKRKLAAIDAKQQAEQSKASEPGKGSSVDHDA
jgi:hypothetical protein